MSGPRPTARVVTVSAFCGICHMRVCVVADATDEEILAHANADNPSGTSLGWCDVIREGEGAPVRCQDFSDRLHVMVGC